MPLYLTGKDVGGLIDIGTAIEALAAAFTSLAKTEAINHPRRRYRLIDGRLNVMLAADGASRRFALKAYGSNGVSCHHVLLYSADHGLLAIIEAGLLGQIRTGAASGLATRLLARPKARRLGLIGSGRQARTQLLAIAAVRPLESVEVFARDGARLGAFCALMRKETGLAVRPAASARAAVEGADIVVTATTSATPVVAAAWLRAGMHVNTIGANAATRQELEAEAFAGDAIVVVDDVDQARKEAGELIELERQGRLDWSRVRALAEVVAEQPGPAETSTDSRRITIFKSLGTAIEDLAAASIVYDRAMQAGIGAAV
jgi:ornithine cyclodeaminase/alanine dehydrogenase-like protein (mu-crystallin family)